MINITYVLILSALHISYVCIAPGLLLRYIHVHSREFQKLRKGQTAMLMAANNDLPVVAKTLIMGNADVNQAKKNKDGEIWCFNIHNVCVYIYTHIFGLTSYG